MQILIDFEDWLEESDRAATPAADVRKFSDWLKKRDKDIISDFRSDYIKEFLEHLLVREDKQRVIKMILSLLVFLEFLKAVVILEKMDFKPEWLERVIKEEFCRKT